MIDAIFTLSFRNLEAYNHSLLCQNSAYAYDLCTNIELNKIALFITHTVNSGNRVRESLRDLLTPGLLY